ncbi:MAG: glycosyltransferase [Polaromonas sp.]
MKVLLPTLGSAGDVYPFLAVGQALQARGHAVEVITNPVFAPVVAAAGLAFAPVGTAAHYTDTLSSPKLWHPVDGFGVFWRRMARHAMAPVYRHIESQASQGPCVVLATPLMLGARLAQEKLGVPLVTAYTAATMLRSCQYPLTLAHWRVPPWPPSLLRPALALAWQALDRFKLHPMLAADLPALRHALGLPPLTGSVFGHWVHSPQAGVTLFPPWFAPAPGDWPAQVRQAGFPLYDGDKAQGLDAGLQAFLAAGAPPVVFTPGSAMGHGHAFFEAAVRTCQALGRRGVLLTTQSQQIPADLPATVHHSAYAPFGLLLPRAAALVHHGGIGNTAQALRAGLAQLITPMAFDQFDNAMRLERLGVAASVARQDTAFTTMAPQLKMLLESPDVAAACQVAAQRMADDRGLDVVCDLLESVQ